MFFNLFHSGNLPQMEVIVDEIAKRLTTTDISAILTDMNPKGKNDPIIHFL